MGTSRERGLALLRVAVYRQLADIAATSELYHGVTPLRTELLRGFSGWQANADAVYVVVVI